VSLVLLDRKAMLAQLVHKESLDLLAQTLLLPVPLVRQAHKEIKVIMVLLVRKVFKVFKAKQET
jgi:hypothetical protein